MDRQNTAPLRRCWHTDRADPDSSAECQCLRGAVRALDPRGCLDRLILFGERRLRRVVDEFVAHYHRERNHQGLGNELIAPKSDHRAGTNVRCRERLGGLLRDHAA
jgi:hypothetical protein